MNLHHCVRNIRKQLKSVHSKSSNSLCNSHNTSSTWTAGTKRYEEVNRQDRSGCTSPTPALIYPPSSWTGRAVEVHDKHEERRGVTRSPDQNEVISHPRLQHIYIRIPPGPGDSHTTSQLLTGSPKRCDLVACQDRGGPTPTPTLGLIYQLSSRTRPVGDA